MEPDIKTALIVFCSVVFVSIFFYGVVSLFEEIDTERMEAYTKYEACVVEQYGVLPSTYYQSHGVVPECE